MKLFFGVLFVGGPERLGRVRARHAPLLRRGRGEFPLPERAAGRGRGPQHGTPRAGHFRPPLRRLQQRHHEHGAVVAARGRAQQRCALQVTRIKNNQTQIRNIREEVNGNCS